MHASLLFCISQPSAPEQPISATFSGEKAELEMPKKSEEEGAMALGEKEPEAELPVKEEKEKTGNGIEQKIY